MHLLIKITKLNSYLINIRWKRKLYFVSTLLKIHKLTGDALREPLIGTMSNPTFI